jgi:hypothetical protein
MSHKLEISRLSLKEFKQVRNLIYAHSIKNLHSDKNDNKDTHSNKILSYFLIHNIKLFKYPI